MRHRLVAWFLMVGSLVIAPLGTAAASDSGACSSACLSNWMNRYLEHLVRHDASGVAIKPSAEVRENTALVKFGQGGSWQEISRIRARQDFVDPSSGNIITRCAVEMRDGKIGSLSVRLETSGARLSEVETSFNRGTGPFNAANLLEPDIVWAAVVPADRRVPRKQMIELADRYFDAISKHDASAPIFSGRCDRYESGKKMTNDATNAGNESGAVTCAQSLLHLTGQAVVQRRYPLVDEQRGVVLGYGFILHQERKTPNATGLAEVFKITDGTIRAIENVETIVPFPPDGGYGREP